MSQYIDGFVIPLPTHKIEEYRKLAELAGRVWREHGALEYYEFILEDSEARDMKTFPQLAAAGPGETVIFSWIVYRSRADRDLVNTKVMEDPRMKDMMDCATPVFDCAKMAYGGFELLVKA